jgi:hypothetical protein
VILFQEDKEHDREKGKENHLQDKKYKILSQQKCDRINTELNRKVKR